jgi:D-aminoacyl-tRNA deacylase
MIGLLQRVSRASVTVDGHVIAEIGSGLLVLVGVERGDGETEAKRLAQRLVEYRVFPDAANRMNVNVKDAGGRVLLVPQFTLAADTRSGTRPGFSSAAAPADAAKGFAALAEHVADQGVSVAIGRFGATMSVALQNEGPVTFWLQVSPTG